MVMGISGPHCRKRRDGVHSAFALCPAVLLASFSAQLDFVAQCDHGH